jgi:hypothetical protein
MERRGWVATPGGTWARLDPSGIRQLARYANGDEVISPACPIGLPCQPVIAVSEPAEWTAWTYKAWAERWRHVELVVVGDQGRCEEVRLRDAARYTNSGMIDPACRGPLYFKRPPAVPIVATPSSSPSSPESTWATGE